MRTRRKSVKSAQAAAFCGATVFAVLPANVLAGPMSAASLSSVTAPVEKVYYRRYCGHRHYYGGYYLQGYRYDPSGAIFAGAALGLLGAGIAAASPYSYGYGYPGYYGWGW